MKCVEMQHRARLDDNALRNPSMATAESVTEPFFSAAEIHKKYKVLAVYVIADPK